MFDNQEYIQEYIYIIIHDDIVSVKGYEKINFTHLRDISCWLDVGDNTILSVPLILFYGYIYDERDQHLREESTII